jgi:hypothetical protein
MRYFLKPCHGYRVIDEKTKQPLPLEGKGVEQSQYWNRLIKCGDVEIIAPKKKKET